MTDQNKIFIFDTTLRDGEQAPGASMNKEEKLRIATLLDRMHVDVIEAGFPVSSQDDFEAVKAIAGLAQYSIVAGLSRAVRADIDTCAEALKPAKRKRIHTFISTSALHMEHKLRMTPDQVHAAVIDSVSYARNLCDDVEWGCEDGTRSDRDFLCRCIESAITAGARTVNIADTVGFTMPGEFVDLISNLMNRIPNIDKARFSVHCHDDLGLSVANSLAAISAGARQVECTINGIGERAGNAALEEIVMALDVRRDLLGCHTDVSTEYLSEISQLVSAITGFQVPPNKAIVGANAFAHESGIHQHGVMRHRGTYEIIEPSAVGVSQSTLVMGKHSGRHAFRMKLREMGKELSEDAFEDAFTHFKSYADGNKTVSDEVIRAIAEKSLMMEVPVAMVLKTILVHTDSSGPQVARLSVTKDEKIETAEAHGDKPFDAIVAAFQHLHAHPARMAGYEVNLISNNGKGVAKATIKLVDGTRMATGQAEDEDTFTAFAEAYLAALTRITSRETATGLNRNG
jgi:2-isopropylmalate synthase